MFTEYERSLKSLMKSIFFQSHIFALAAIDLDFFQRTQFALVYFEWAY